VGGERKRGEGGWEGEYGYGLKEGIWFQLPGREGGGVFSKGKGKGNPQGNETIFSKVIGKGESPPSPRKREGGGKPGFP